MLNVSNAMPKSCCNLKHILKHNLKHIILVGETLESVKATDLKEKHQIALPQNHSSNGQVPCQDH